MSVIPITVFFSLLLAGIFIALFAREQRRRSYAGAERDSLLPLAEEQRHTVTSAAQAADCGCHDGSRPPCAGCQKHQAATPSPDTPTP